MQKNAAMHDLVFCVPAAPISVSRRLKGLAFLKAKSLIFYIVQGGRSQNVINNDYNVETLVSLERRRVVSIN